MNINILRSRATHDSCDTLEKKKRIVFFLLLGMQSRTCRYRARCVYIRGAIRRERDARPISSRRPPSPDAGANASRHEPLGAVCAASSYILSINYIFSNNFTIYYRGSSDR